MSDYFVMLVDTDVSATEATDVCEAVLTEFRKRRLITGSANGDCVLGGMGFQPGPAMPNLYELGEREDAFWELRTCGVEPCVGRNFNQWALGPSFEECACSVCGLRTERLRGTFSEQMFDAIIEWVEESAPARLRCPSCSNDIPLTEWRFTPPLGLGNLSFTFWNWPLFEPEKWRIDIHEVVGEVTMHTIVTTWGHI